MVGKVCFLKAAWISLCRHKNRRLFPLLSDDGAWEGKMSPLPLKLPLPVEETQGEVMCASGVMLQMSIHHACDHSLKSMILGACFCF